jgi:UDP-glucose 4-epimerase
MNPLVKKNDISRILVTGATGAVGPQVVATFCSAQYRIRTLSLDPPPAGIWPEGVETMVGDVTNPNDVQSAIRGTDAVIHLAALLHTIDPTPELLQKYERVNVGGTTVVAEAAARENVKKLLYFSTIAVYGPGHGRILNEDSLPEPDSAYAQTKLAAENRVLDCRRPDGQPIGTVLRLGAVYGSRIKGNYQRLLRSLNKGRFVPVGNGSNRRTLVYDKDVARAAVLAMQHPEAAGRVYNVSDGRFHTLNEVILVICGALGRRPPRFSLPIATTRTTAGMLEDGAKLFGRRSPITRSTIDKYTEDIAVDSERIQKELGFKPQYDLRTGWKETVREMRESGAL